MASLEMNDCDLEMSHSEWPVCFSHWVLTRTKSSNLWGPLQRRSGFVAEMNWQMQMKVGVGGKKDVRSS